VCIPPFKASVEEHNADREAHIDLGQSIAWRIANRFLGLRAVDRNQRLKQIPPNSAMMIVTEADMSNTLHTLAKNFVARRIESVS